MVFTAFTVLYNDPLCLVPNIFITTHLLSPKSPIKINPFLHSPWQSPRYFLSLDLPFLDISYPWDHTA